MQSISKPPQEMMNVRQVAVTEPPPPPPEPEPEKPEPEPENPPELEAPPSEPLSLDQLELSLDPGAGLGGGGGSLQVNIAGATQAGGLDELFSMAELDQKPRPTHQPGPAITDRVRQHSPGQVYIIFIVNEQGRVEQAKTEKASHPVLARAALEAVRQWRFEPGQRKGEAVSFRMRVPVTFPEM